MNNLLKKILIKTISLILLSQSIIHSQKISLDAYIEDSYLHATFGPTQSVKTSKKKNRFDLPQLEEKLLTQREKQKIAFSVINIQSQQTASDVTIDKTFIEKMELIAGGAKSEEHLVSKIFNNIHTTLGKSWAIQQLIKPTTNIKQLHHRQNVIQSLGNNPQLLHKLDMLLAKLKKAESSLLTFWHQQQLDNQQLLQSVYFSKWHKKLKIVNHLVDTLNTNSIPLEISNKLSNVNSIITGALGTPLFMAWGIQEFYEQQDINYTFWQAFKKGINDYVHLLQSNKISLKQKVLLCLAIPYQGFIAYLLADLTKNKINLGKYLQNSLIDTASYLQHTKIIKQILRQNNELLQAIPSLKYLFQFDDKQYHSAQYAKLLKILDTNTFKGKPSVFSFTGRIFATHKLMTLVKNEFVPMLNVIAELDTYVALTKLYKNQQKNVPYSFVKLKESESPYLQAINFWNPFINPETVVTNTIELTQNKGKNVILTGPNTGGKSTVIKALLINILFAQTFGMAAAEQFIMTPFKKLNCYLNITDDIAAGISLFKAEILRAKELTTTLKTLPPQDFCFTIIDEAFSGTSPQEGEFASYKFAEQLAQFNNGITIIATHYHKLIDLEQENPGAFKNYHVEVLRNENGSLQRTFKLFPEPSRMSIALDILKEEGIL